jgi:RNA polymerase sigma-70 factor (ECF subfamily)
MSEGDDKEIISRVRRHDEVALQELLQKYCQPLRAFSFSMLRCHDLAEQAVSNVFLKLWQRRERLVIRRTVRSYLFAAAGNQSINLWNERRKQAVVQLDDDLAAKLIDARSIESDILYRELCDEIETLLSRLPPQRQLVFRMNRLEGLSYWEIARELTLSQHTVQNHMTEAMRQLLRDSVVLRQAVGLRDGAPHRSRRVRSSSR